MTSDTLRNDIIQNVTKGLENLAGSSRSGEKADFGDYATIAKYWNTALQEYREYQTEKGFGNEKQKVPDSEIPLYDAMTVLPLALEDRRTMNYHFIGEGNLIASQIAIDQGTICRLPFPQVSQ
jgi:hypothetical protein